MGDASRKELQALKKALVVVLQEENPLPPHQQRAREAELDRRLSSGSPSPEQALDSRDLSIMSRLLSQVHKLMQCDNEGKEVMQSNDVGRPDFNDQHVETGSNTVETVVDIASAAAEAARTAAASTSKNIEVMETLLLHSEMHVPPTPDEDGCLANALKDESSRQPIIDKDIVKRLERQNRITHWILGFIIVATAIWRFKMLSMILGVRKTFTNPFQSVGEMVTEGLKGDNKDQNGEGKGFRNARTVLPSILGGEEKKMKKKKEKMKRSTTEDSKVGEAFNLSLDNVLQVNGTSDKSGSEGVSEEGSSSE